MTRKKNLLIEYYTLQNQINALSGNEQTDIEAYTQSWQFHDEAQRGKEYELKERVEMLKRSLDKTKREMEIQAKADAFYATAEGQVFRTETEERIKRGRQDWQALEHDTMVAIEAKLFEALGKDWSIISYSPTNLRFGVRAKSGDRQFVFGQEVEIYYDPHKRWNSDEERFEMNFGSCGSFDILDTSAESFAAFHIGVGLLLANKELCEWLRTTLRNAKVETDRLADYLSQQHNNLTNPLGI